MVNSTENLKPWFGKMDFMISTVPYAHDMSNYISCVKPYGYFIQVGQPVNGELTSNNINMIFKRVNFNGSLIGGISETPEVMNYCAENKIYPLISTPGKGFLIGKMDQNTTLDSKDFWSTFPILSP